MSMMKVVYKTLLYSQLYFLLWMTVACAHTKGRLHQFSTHGLPDSVSATETKLTALKYIFLFLQGCDYR